MTESRLPDRAAIEAALDASDAYELGLDYQRRGRVTLAVWDPGTGRIWGAVKGSRGRAYLPRVMLGPDGSIRSTSCTCLYQWGCKHVAAILIDVTATRAAKAGMVGRLRGGPAAVPEWKRLLDPIIQAPLPLEPSPADQHFGLQFRINGIGEALKHLSDPVTNQPVSLFITPAQRLGDQWSSVGWPGYYDRNFGDTWLRTWLSNLAAAGPAPSYYSTSSWLELDRFSDQLWPLLAQGLAAGVPFVGNTATTSVRLADTLDLHWDIRRTNKGLILTRGLTADGRPFEAQLAGTIGQSGTFGIRIENKNRTIVVGPATRPLGKAGAQMARLRQITVDEADTGQFWSSAYPGLRQRVTVVSSDASVDLPEPPRANLLVTVAFPDAVTADVACAWQYGEREVGWDYTEDDTRDRVQETAIARRANEALSGVPGFRLAARRQLTGAAAVALARALPGLEAAGDVTVRLEGTVPDYREPEELPLVTVKVADADDNDWFDLGVTVTIEGRDVPFAPLFSALARGDEWLILDDGTLLRTDQPVFARLRDLIAEARRLTDRPGPLRLNRYSSSLWGEFADLADVVEQTEQWRVSVDALARLAGGQAPVEPVPLPAGLLADLRPYQVAGLQWLAFLHRHRLGGILADDMGLGKTVEVLALLAHVREAAGDRRPFLVVAPASVVPNWGLEAARFTPGLRTVVLSATMNRSGVSQSELAEADLVVVSYAILRLDFDNLRGVEWAGLILDEAQFLKNPKTRANECARQLRAPFKLALTGTPMENNLMELWAILAVVAPGLFPFATRFREDYVGVVNSAVRADDREAAEEGEQALRRLRRRVKPVLLRRTKEQVAPELPERIEQVLSVELAPRHRRIYDTLLQRERQRILGLLDDYEANRFEVFRSLMLLRRAALDVSLIDEKTYAGVPSAKLDVLFEQLEEVVASGHRALVFSQFTSFLSRIRDRAQAAGLQYAYLDGSTTKRAAVIKSFREGQAPLFLISLKAGGFGLNLTEADYVFLMDPWWNPATENQAIDRTHRIGQTRTVMVFRLVSAGTIEDKVMALKERKAALFNAVLDDDTGAFAQSLAADDIRALFDGG